MVIIFNPAALFDLPTACASDPAAHPDARAKAHCAYVQGPT